MHWQITALALQVLRLMSLRVSPLGSLSLVFQLSLGELPPKRGYFLLCEIIRYHSPIFSPSAHGLSLRFFRLPSMLWVVESVPIIQTEALIDGDCGRSREGDCDDVFALANREWQDEGLAKMVGG